MILTNNQREYLGLEKIEQHWEKVQIYSDSRFVEGDIYLYFDGNTIRKLIITNDNFYHECKLHEKTQDRKIVLPKTKRGKTKKLNYTSIMKMTRIGVYLYFDGEYVTLANHTTQITFYQSKISDFYSWINNFIEDTTEQDLKDIDDFKNAKRRRVKNKEGDFFCFKVNRREYGFGRVLFNVEAYRKTEESKSQNNYGFKNLMGKPYLVKVYDIISDTPDIDLCKLKELTAFPSEYIMDNVLFYGEYEVIGYLPLEDDELDFPISYGRSISALNIDTVYLQYGKIYRECSIFNYDKHINVQSEDGNIHYNFFRYEHIGFYPFESIYKLKGEEFKAVGDLRHTEYLEIKNEIFKQFGLDPNKSYSDNYKMLYSKE